MTAFLIVLACALYIPCLCIIGREVWRLGQSQPDQAAHPCQMPGTEGQNMPWPPPRELLYVRPTADGFEMACDCSAVTRVRLGGYNLPEIAITCRCRASHWIDLTALEHA